MRVQPRLLDACQSSGSTPPHPFDGSQESPWPRRPSKAPSPRWGRASRPFGGGHCRSKPLRSSDQCRLEAKTPSRIDFIARAAVSPPMRYFLSGLLEGAGRRRNTIYGRPRAPLVGLRPYAVAGLVSVARLAAPRIKDVLQLVKG